MTTQCSYCARVQEPAANGGCYSCGAPLPRDTRPATKPGFSRNKIETTTHNDGTDGYVLGVLRSTHAFGPTVRNSAVIIFAIFSSFALANL